MPYCVGSMAPGKTLSRDSVVQIVTLYGEGIKTAEIARRLKVSKRVVQKWIKRYKDNGEASIPTPLPRSGRPRKISPRVSHKIKRSLEKDPSFTAKKIKQEYIGDLQDVSVRCISDHLNKDLKYKSYRARVKPIISKKNKEDRLTFAEDKINWSLDQWREVLWSDEATFSVSCGSKVGRVRRREGSDPHDPKYCVKVAKFPDTLMVWGCFSYYGLGSLVFLEKNVTMKADIYLTLLMEHLPDSFDKCNAKHFMQDGAGCHIAHLVTDWLKDCCVSFWKKWPGNSPDLNPIENLWHLIKVELRNRDTSTIAKLKAEITDIWNNFDGGMLQRLVDSLPRRVAEVKKRKGNATKY